MGAVLKYSTPEQMQERIDAYFTDCAGEWMKDEDGRLVLDKRGRPIKVNERAPTITGLALALGFANRKSLWDYQRRPAFRDTVTIAKSRVEAYAEARLFDRDGYAGAMYFLAAAFRWGCPQEEQPARQAATFQIVQPKTPPTPATVRPAAP